MWCLLNEKARRDNPAGAVAFIKAIGIMRAILNPEEHTSLKHRATEQLRKIGAGCSTCNNR
jgi:hypothetical protein